MKYTHSNGAKKNRRQRKSTDNNGCKDRRQAAEYLSISVRLLDQIASDGQIPRVKIGSKTLFRISDLDAYIDSKVQRLTPGV